MHYNFDYFERTSKIDMKENYQFFLQHFNGQSILDLGCGSGRDSNYFKQQNYDVSSVDNSVHAKHFASREYNVEVDIIDIEQDVDGVFDGIWSCASLVHMDKNRILQIMEKLKKNLSTKGLIYISLKYGSGTLINNNQVYHLYDETIVNQILELGYKLCDMKVKNCSNPMNCWIEFIIQKCET